MKFGVITQHNKDSCSDKIEPRQLVWHIEATFSWQRPSEIWKEKRRAYLNIWFYFILLSKGFRIGGEKRGGGRLLLDEREREWLLQWLKSEKNQICFPCMHAAAAKEQNSPPPTAATTTSLLSRTPHHRHRPPSHRHTKASYLQRRPSPLMTASLHSTDHSALKPFFFWRRGDLRLLRLIVTKWHHWKLLIPDLSVKSEAQGISYILGTEGRVGERLSEISFLKYQPLKPQWHVLHSTLHFFTWHNHWSNNGRQVKARV